MIELADVFRRFGDDYLNAHGASMLPSHKRVINDVIQCRTEALGGHVYGCDTCQTTIYAYHSCKNRHCPKCHTDQTMRWLEKRQAEMLPVSYFHITATVPESLREIFRSNQVDCYSILMNSTAEAILELARDPRYVGGTVGILSLLHTWTQQFIYHPHSHNLVTAGGVSSDGSTWFPALKNYLVPVNALSRLIRGKVMTALKEALQNIILPQKAWKQEWVVHCVPWGVGEMAVVNYLARYAFRIATTNRRILAMDDQTVTFRYKDRKKGEWRTCRLPGEEFMRRYLQHVLPQGFHKIRYFGLWHPSKRGIVQKIRLFLALQQPPPSVAPTDLEPTQQEEIENTPTRVHVDSLCPHCRKGRLILLQSIPRPVARAP